MANKDKIAWFFMVPLLCCGVFFLGRFGIRSFVRLGESGIGDAIRNFLFGVFSLGLAAYFSYLLFLALKHNPLKMKNEPKKEITPWCATCLHFRYIRNWQESYLGLDLDKMPSDRSQIPCNHIAEAQSTWEKYFALERKNRTLYPKECEKWALSPRPHKMSPPIGNVLLGLLIVAGIIGAVVLLFRGMNWLDNNTNILRIGRVIRSLAVGILVISGIVAAIVAWVRIKR